MGAPKERYDPGEDFNEDTKAPLLDIPATDSTELWLIQWPINQLQSADFHGKELSINLHHNGRLGGFESSSGKSYEVVSFASQEPDATVFLASGSESKVVGKISRRVCLVHYPEPEELEKPGFGIRGFSSSQRSEGSLRKISSRHSATSLKLLKHRRSQVTGEIAREAMASAHSPRQGSSGPLQKRSTQVTGEIAREAMASAHSPRQGSSGPLQKRSERSSAAERPDITEKSAEQSPVARQVSNTASDSEQIRSEKSKKKRKIQFEE